MSQHKAIISWKCISPDFLKGKYSREHIWTFDGGLTIAASPSPSNVPLPYSNPAHVDPEEAYVASISSCHMLTFLYLASRQGFLVDSYKDEAIGMMTKNEKGVPWVSSVTLHPKIVYSGKKLPTPPRRNACIISLTSNASSPTPSRLKSRSSDSRQHFRQSPRREARVLLQAQQR